MEVVNKLVVWLVEDLVLLYSAALKENHLLLLRHVKNSLYGIETCDKRVKRPWVRGQNKYTPTNTWS